MTVRSRVALLYRLSQSSVPKTVILNTFSKSTDLRNRTCSFRYVDAKGTNLSESLKVRKGVLFEPKLGQLLGRHGLHRKKVLQRIQSFYRVIHFLKMFTYLFLRERERAQAGEGQREKERERIPNRLRTVSAEPDMELELMSCEIMT